MSTLRAFAACVAVSLCVVAAPASAAASFRTLSVTTRDGVTLQGNVFTPDTAGLHPVILFVTSWALPNLEYLAQAQQLADAGYVVASYTPRGFYTSGGAIDTAGPKDIGDLSEVIDWVLANTPADATRLGAAGVSYGAGLTLIGSAFDSRIRAVAALSAWTDLSYSLFANQTRHLQSAGLLWLSAELTGRPSAEMRQVLTDFFANEALDGVVAYAQVRGAATYLPRINANRPAILIGNAYGDSFFAPNQLGDFFTQLTGPKRLELRPGDHAIPELTGILGLPNDAWLSVRRWFDQYLRGVNTGIATEPPVQLLVRGQGAYEAYPSWSAITSSAARYHLSEVHWWNREGDLQAGAQTGWSATILGGGDTVANGGVVLLTNGAEALTGEPPSAWIPAVDRTNAGVWQSDWLSSARRVRGAAHLHLTVTPGRSGQTTVVAYLYDTNWAGTGSLVTHVAVTLRDVVAGQPYTVDADFPATAYDVPSGDRLSLVIDTVDPLYADKAPALTSVKFSSPAGNPSYVSVPLK
ncbi:acyl esterase [Corallococcus sp. H22C18031201]|uniref:CocE/NonD family hydrolase n=1 Tax=Citreicoccus inhibens TaxID=2849499 RepID=UPI000E762B08|nr:CocE/NonD family hydrolase [Citreicoccus inhibens]MBU8894001.1 prolyl oligopeptidase family serine peptidase [Citreicoccus inhibens]RJS23274.1 acyl esterase [Corallococcus sp. H22C18031201]